MPSMRYIPLERHEVHCLQIGLRSNPKLFPRYRYEVGKFLREYVPLPSLVEDLVMVLDEALTNIVLHAYRREADHPIDLNICLEVNTQDDSTQLTVTLKDRGPGGQGFEPSQVLATNLAHLAAGEPSGYGLVLMFQLLDRVTYERSERGENRLVLEKRLSHETEDLLYVRRLIDELQRLRESAREQAATALSRVVESA